MYMYENSIIKSTKIKIGEEREGIRKSKED
jgi:hypothetical protein